MIHRLYRLVILFSVVVASMLRVIYLDGYAVHTVVSHQAQPAVVSDTVHTQPAPVTAPHESSNHSTTNIPPPDKRKIVWSSGRGDRSGMAIGNMLQAHAYAVHHNYTYGGACRRDLPKSATQQSRLRQHMELLDALGLSEVLKFDCPPNGTIPLLRRNQYGSFKKYMTGTYFEFLQTLIKYPNKPERPTIAVHVRRGDITPCGIMTNGYYRYLPNQHYLRLIDHYNPKNDSDVVVYSESDSFETFDDFRERGYHVVLDGPLAEVWQGIMMSDVVILSRSAFSLVPAYLTKGTVVFTECWLSPLPGWVVVKEDVNETALDLQRLNVTCQRQGKRAPT